MTAPTFYYDVFSPYAYLAAERIGQLIPDADWRPIFIGGLFKLNGRTSWVLTDERRSRMAEIEGRAERYGLPPITWPTSVPENWLGLDRAATVARRSGLAAPFALGSFRAFYAQASDPSTPTELRRIATDIGLDPDLLLTAIGEQAVKDELKQTTEEAHARGVPGVPTVVVGGDVFWGDDRLDEAVRRAREASEDASGA